MKIQVFGTGDVLHGVSDEHGVQIQLLRLPPGIHATVEEDPYHGKITDALAQYLIDTTNGHVKLYVPPVDKPIEVMVSVKDDSEKTKRQEALAAAQNAQREQFEQGKKLQDERYKQAEADRAAEKVRVAGKK